jgi:hypothetical protein
MADYIRVDSRSWTGELPAAEPRPLPKPPRAPALAFHLLVALGMAVFTLSILANALETGSIINGDRPEIAFSDNPIGFIGTFSLWLFGLVAFGAGGCLAARELWRQWQHRNRDPLLGVRTCHRTDRDPLA